MVIGGGVIPPLVAVAKRGYFLAQHSSLVVLGGWRMLQRGDQPTTQHRASAVQTVGVVRETRTSLSSSVSESRSFSDSQAGRNSGGNALKCSLQVEALDPVRRIFPDIRREPAVA